MKPDIRTKRWDDPRAPDDGWRLLITRYRPRALPKKDETWDQWIADAGPSRELLADFHGKGGPPIEWAEYERRYLAEMRGRPAVLAKVAMLARRGRLTLLCSSACTDPARCHRTLLKKLIEEAV